MDNSFSQQELSDTQQRPDGFLASLRNFDGILPLMRRFVNWLADLVQLTEEEQRDAGIYLGNQSHSDEYPVE